MFNFTKTSDSTTKPQIPAGTHGAYLYSIVDNGTQEVKYKGETKFLRKVRFTFEFPKFVSEFEGVQKPLALSVDYTLSLSEKAKLRSIVNSMSGRNLTDNELYTLKLESFVGKPYTVTVIHNQATTGKVYTNIINVSPLIDGLVLPDMFNDIVLFSLDNFTEESFDLVPKRQKEIIMKSPEYQKIMTKGAIEDTDLPF